MSESITTLTLILDNPCNSTISDADGKALYFVFTEHGAKTTTQVRNADNEVLASLEWRDVLPDRVVLGALPQSPYMSGCAPA
ncbi:hypothetical protein A0H81_07868 [Grifola frondosa]|uniref:DUF6593 domain-containing protein n=1 Tax=Grifola frondosa TaxID=5627 RepID=A0A1C7M5A0_GRIFR|nr:hypothetical protein A0H81_07868 [Grifola frondosa]